MTFFSILGAPFFQLKSNSVELPINGCSKYVKPVGRKIMAILFNYLHRLPNILFHECCDYDSSKLIFIVFPTKTRFIPCSEFYLIKLNLVSTVCFWTSLEVKFAVTPWLASMTFNYVSFNILYGLMLACRQLIFSSLNIKLN